MEHHFLKIALFIYSPFALTIFFEKYHQVGIKSVGVFKGVLIGYIQILSSEEKILVMHANYFCCFSLVCNHHMLLKKR